MRRYRPLHLAPIPTINHPLNHHNASQFVLRYKDPFVWAYRVGDHGGQHCGRKTRQHRCILGAREGTDEVHTWPFSIVAVELGREASSYSHLDEENDRV